MDSRLWERLDRIDFPPRFVNPDKRLRRLPAGARADLFRVLTSPSNVRADVIRQFHERLDGEGMAEALMDLEEDELLRLRVVQMLREFQTWPG